MGVSFYALVQCGVSLLLLGGITARFLRFTQLPDSSLLLGVAVAPLAPERTRR